MDIINPFGRPILKVEREFCGRPLSLEVGRLAFRSHAAVLATYGQTTVLATVNVGDVNPNLDYFPLSVEYEERFYAAGKISGSRYIKREGRPSDDAVLTGRLIDRPIRPLFPKGYRHEIQAVALVLSLDPQVRADSLAMVAVSAAMSLTGVPFDGPISGVRVAVDADGQLVAYPSLDQQQSAILDIMVASNKDRRHDGRGHRQASQGVVDGSRPSIGSRTQPRINHFTRRVDSKSRRPSSAIRARFTNGRHQGNDRQVAERAI